MIFAALLLAAAYVLIIFRMHLTLTQAGGLCCGLLALVWLCLRFYFHRREKVQEPERRQDQAASVDRALYAALLSDSEDAYPPDIPKRIVPDSEPITGAGIPRENTADEEEIPDPGLTRLLVPETMKHQWSLAPKKYGDPIYLEERPLIVGKKKDSADICLADETVSRYHARLFVRKDCAYVTDLNSTNGTFVNGSRLAPHEERTLADGDLLCFGETAYVLHHS